MISNVFPKKMIPASGCGNHRRREQWGHSPHGFPVLVAGVLLSTQTALATVNFEKDNVISSYFIISTN
jgi:hypothetical protein